MLLLAVYLRRSISLAAPGLELISKFYDVHIHAETGGSVQAGIGEVLNSKSGIGM
jgi:hypothetical protein